MQHKSNEGEALHRSVSSYEVTPTDPNYYLNYWKQLASDDRLLKGNAAFVQAAESTQTRLRQLDDDLVGYVEQESYGGMETVIEWYERLGSLNQLEGAESSLERAAEITVREIKDREYVENYTPSRLSLICGNLFHDLLILNGRKEIDRDLEHSRGLAEAATYYYQAAIEAEDDDILNTRVQRALQSVLDVEYELLHQEWPLVPMGHNQANSQIITARRRYRDLLERETTAALTIVRAHDIKIEELDLERQNAHDSGKNRKKERALAKQMTGVSNQAVGAMLEWFAPLVYRYNLYRNHQEAEATIRRSLHREEEPRFKPAYKKARHKNEKKTYPQFKHSVDAVTSHFENGYFADSTHYQYKIGSAGRALYLPQITVLDDYKQRIEKFMAKDYTGRKTPKDINPRLMTWFGVACEFMKENLDKATRPSEDERDQAMFDQFVDLVQSDLDAA